MTTNNSDERRKVIDDLKDNVTLHLKSFLIYIGMMVRVFANSPGDLGSIPGRVIPKTKKKKCSLMSPCLTLSIIRYVSWVKWVNPGKRVVPSLTPWSSSYRIGSTRVILDYGH